VLKNSILLQLSLLLMRGGAAILDFEVVWFLTENSEIPTSEYKWNYMNCNILI